MLRCVLPVLVGLSLAVPALAQNARPFPATALRGAMVVTQPPEIVLNGQPARLSPGARIRGENNLLLMSGALVGHKLLVHYTLEANGLVHEVWILTADEQARQPWPTTPAEAQRWSFDATAQAWTRR